MTLLFIANTDTGIHGMNFLIEKLKELCDFTPILICQSCYYETDKYTVINFENSDFYEKKKASRSISATEKPKKNSIKKTPLWKQLFWGSKYFYIMVRDEQKARKILKSKKPDAVIVECDRMTGMLQAFLKNAGNAPVIKVPISRVFSNGTSRIGNRKNDPDLLVSNKFWDYNRWLIKLNPLWMRREDNVACLFLPFGYTLAGYLRKMISMSPWMSGASQYTTYAMVADENEKIEIEKISDNKVIVTGCLEEYYMMSEESEITKKKFLLSSKYRIKNEKIIILGLPQLAEHNFTTWNIHRKNMDKLFELMNHVFGSFYVSLHPKSRKEDYEYLNKKYNFVFLEEQLSDILSAGDIYVGMSISSTILWAKRHGIPTVQLDVDDFCSILIQQQWDKVSADMIKARDEEKKLKEESELRCVPKEILKILKEEKIEDFRFHHGG